MNRFACGHVTVLTMAPVLVIHQNLEVYAPPGGQTTPAPTAVKRIHGHPGLPAEAAAVTAEKQRVTPANIGLGDDCGDAGIRFCAAAGSPHSSGFRVSGR